MMKTIFFLAILLSQLIILSADGTSRDIYDYNLIELSKLKVNSVSKMPQHIFEVPATVRIITKQEIKENAYFTLDEALSGLPGFQFRNTMGFNSYIFQRGIPSQNNLILILIDGIQVNELNSGGFYAGGQYNLDNIERIEVVYGPASVAYGTNAVSGIVNLITKENKGLDISIAGGNFNTLNTSLNYGYIKNDLKFRLSGMYKTTEKANLKNENGDYNWTSTMENFETDYAIDFKFQYKSVKAGINYLNKQTPASTYYPSAGTIYQDYGTYWDIFFFNAYLKHKTKFKEQGFFSTSLYYRNSTVRDNSIFKIVDTAQIGYYRPNFLVGSESIFDYSVKKNLNILTGITLEKEFLAESYSITYSESPLSPPPSPPEPNMLENNLMSLFIEGKYKIERFSIIGGYRFDNSSVYDQVLTPRVSLMYHLPKLNMKLLYAEAFRAPKPWDYTYGLGNPNLEPENMKSLEFANTFYLSTHLSFNWSVYRNRLNNAIIKKTLGQDDNFRWVNHGIFDTDGTEISALYSAKKLRLSANYTYNYSHDEQGNIIDEIAIHSLNFGITYLFYDHFRLNLRANYPGKRKNTRYISTTNSEYIEPALIFNSVFSIFDFYNLDIQLIVKNLFDTEYYHTSNRLVERYRQPQRTILIKAVYHVL